MIATRTIWKAYLEDCRSPEALVRVRVDRPFTLRSWNEARGVVLATAERRWAERRAMEILEAMMWMRRGKEKQDGVPGN